MPVVSKGEFTVSRLDDGVSSHLHVGWLMADGTFTDTYPGENLLDTSLTLNNSSDTIFDGWKNGTSTVEKSSGIMHVIVAPEVSQTGYSIHYKGSRLLKNTKYFFSIDAKGSGNLRITYRIQNTAGEWAQGWTEMTAKTSLTADYSRYVGSFTTPNWDMRDVQVAFYPQGSGTEAWQTKPKLEISKSATIYTPAPSEDYSLAYPKYRGEYTDTIEADSTDPNRYTWTAYLGEQGPPTGVISQNTVPSSPYVGMLWQNTGNVSGYISNATYRWNGSAWEIYQFTAQNIMADTFTGFTFQGVKMIASEFISHQEFDRVIQPAPESIIENHVTDISIADGRLLIETNVDTIHDLSAGVKWTDQVRMETTVDDTLGFIIDGIRRWGQDDTMSYSTLIQNSEYIALLPNSRDAMSEKDMVTNNNWRNVVATKHCGRQLWDGAQYMTSYQIVTPMAKLSDCLNGWLLRWQRYNPGVGLDSSRYFYQPITKGHPSGKGITTYISAPASDTNNGGVPAATKYVYVTDTTITGYDANSVSPGNNWALSGVFGW